MISGNCSSTNSSRYTFLVIQQVFSLRINSINWLLTPTKENLSFSILCIELVPPLPKHALFSIFLGSSYSYQRVFSAILYPRLLLAICSESNTLPRKRGSLHSFTSQPKFHYNREENFGLRVFFLHIN